MSNETETVVTAGKPGGLASMLDKRFRFTERGSSLKTEIGAGCIAFFIAVCALVMNTQIIGAAYGNYAGSYLAATLVCFVGSLLLGLVCNLPLVQTANMALSAAVISMLSADTGLTYWNMMAVTLVGAIVYLAVVLTPAKKLFMDALPVGVRKALPVGLGLYTVGMALKNAGLVVNGALTDAGQLMTLERFYFWIMVCATVLYIVLRALRRNNALLKTFGLMVGVMWVFGVIFYMNQFIGGQTAATVVYHRVNLVVATDGASPYNIGAGLAGLNFGKVFTEGFNFSGYTGSVFWLFVQGILSFLFLGLYTNTASADAAAVAGGYENDPAAEGKAYVIGAALNAASPLLGVPPTSIGIQSSAAAKDGGKTGLSSVVASIGFFIAAFTWLFIMFFATGTNGAGMWINETETKLAVYVNDTFAFADLVMAFVGASLLCGASRVEWKDAKEAVPFIVTAVGVGFIGNLALGVALGVIAYAVFHFAGAERKENAGTVALLGVIMLIFTVLACTGTGGSAAKSTSSASASTARGTLEEVTDFTFDFNTGDYSFTGADNAQFYVVRVYSVENGAESVSALAQSDRIDADETNAYAGRLDASLTAGEYNAYVLAVASGYSPSTTLVSGVSTAMAKPAVSATWQGDEPDLSIKVTITAGDAIAQSYTVTVAQDGVEIWRSENVPAGELTLTADDIGAALTKDSVYTVTVSVNPVPGYTAPDPVTVTVSEAMSWGSGEASGEASASGEPANDGDADASGEPADDASAEPAAADEASEEPASSEGSAS